MAVRQGCTTGAVVGGLQNPPLFGWHSSDYVYITAMLATSELIRETSQRGRLEQLLPQWRNVPLYRHALSSPDFDFNRLPLIAKQEMREGFPANFLPENLSLQALVENQVV